VESIGDKLKNARENKKITIRDVVKETNINPVYINALENEEFDKFPSETYLIGFLRSYSEYLKLDTGEIIEAYKGYKIGESTTPLEELTKPTTPTISMIITTIMDKYKKLIFPVAIIFSIVLIFYGIKQVISDVSITDGNSIDKIKKEYNKKDNNSKIDKIHTLQLPNGKGIVLVSTKEAVQFLVDKKDVTFLLNKISDNGVIIELYPGGQIESLQMTKPKIIKFSNSSREVIFTLKGLTEHRAKLFIELGKSLKPTDEQIKKELAKDENLSTDIIAQDKENLKIVLEAAFTQSSFIELYIDGDDKKRGFIAAGTKERWEAVRSIQIKIGNAGGLNAKINGKDFVFGKSGHVANKIIKWERDLKNPNLYHIVVKDW
jgi:transcriptional regulator with XRE-family HTH domain